MAYTPYYSAYQPNFYNQNPYLTQPNTQTMQQVMSAGQTQPSINWVSGDREASAYPVAPNNAVALWSQSEPVVYLKQADATGKPSMKIYDLVERVQPSTVPEDKSFATKEELDRVKEEINNLRSEISRGRSTSRYEEGEE